MTVSRPGDDEEEGHPEELAAGERPTFEVGVDEVGPEPGPGSRAQPVDLSVEVGGHVRAGPRSHRLGLVQVGGRPDDVIAPAQEHVEVVLGETHHREEHRGRQRRGEVLMEVTTAARFDVVEQLVDQLANLGLERCDGV